MQKFLKKIIMIVLGMGFLASLSLPSAFAQESVTVSLPAFNITMNDVVVDNSARLYPIVVYKDITYVPMTYNDSRFLGLETKWSADTGLQVNKITQQLSYNPDAGYANTALESASLPGFNIGVNGKAIDNNSEPFPLLVFRDVTYFPLTWRYMVTEFGWTSSFDATNGLIINSKAVTTGLSNNTGNTSNTSNTNNSNNNYNNYNNNNGNNGNNNYNSHNGNTNYNNNNNNNNNSQNYSKQFNNITAIFDRSSNNQPGNLSIKENNNTKKIGNPNYIYGVSYLQAGRRGEYTAVNNVDYTNRWLYTLAVDPSASTITSKNVRINIDTNEVQVLDGNTISNGNNNNNSNQNNNNQNNNNNGNQNNNNQNNNNQNYNNNGNRNNNQNNNQNYSQKFDNITVTLDRSSNKQAGNLYVKENNNTKKIGNPNYIYGVSYNKRPVETYNPINNLSLSNRWVYTLAIDPSVSPLVSKNVRVNIDTNEVQLTNVAP